MINDENNSGPNAPTETSLGRLDTVVCSAWKPIESAMTYQNVGKQIIVANNKRKIGRAAVLSGNLMTSVEEPTLWIPFPPFPRP